MLWRECFGGPMDGQRYPDLGRPFPWNFRRPGDSSIGRYVPDDLRLVGRVKAVWRWVAQQAPKESESSYLG